MNTTGVSSNGQTGCWCIRCSSAINSSAALSQSGVNFLSRHGAPPAAGLACIKRLDSDPRPGLVDRFNRSRTTIAPTADTFVLNRPEQSVGSLVTSEHAALLSHSVVKTARRVA